jgi:hypothetical protein
MLRCSVKSVYALVGCAVVLIAGCSSSVPMNEQVEGTVKLDGVPLPNALVEFVPNDKTTQLPISRATTDSAGHFQLMCANEKPGAVLGSHNVLVRVGRGGDGSKADEMDAPPPKKGEVKSYVVPPIYRDAAKTPLKIDVTASQHSYELNLTSKGAAGHRDRKDRDN